MGLFRKSAVAVWQWGPIGRLRFWIGLARRARPDSGPRFWGSAFLDLVRYLLRRAGPLPSATWPFTVTLDGGVRFEVRPGTDDPMNVYPGREQDAERAILDPLGTSGRTLVDVGSNIGYYATRGAALGARVLAVEANPESAARCRRHLEQNARPGATWRVEAVAAGEGTGNTRLWIPAGTSSRGQVESAGEGPGTWIDVLMVSLDSLTGDLPEIDVLKLDIEGHELPALRGAPRTLSRTRRVVCECNRDKHEIVILLTAAGFAVSSLAFTTYVQGDRG